MIVERVKDGIKNARTLRERIGERSKISDKKNKRGEI